MILLAVNKVTPNNSRRNSYQVNFYSQKDMKNISYRITIPKLLIILMLLNIIRKNGGSAVVKSRKSSAKASKNPSEACKIKASQNLHKKLAHKC